MKYEIHVGDLVDIVPYDTVADDYGIARENWEYQQAMNPQTVADVWCDGEHIELENERYGFTWPNWAFVPHESSVSLPSVEDLL